MSDWNRVSSPFKVKFRCLLPEFYRSSTFIFNGLSTLIAAFPSLREVHLLLNGEEFLPTSFLSLRWIEANLVTDTRWQSFTWLSPINLVFSICLGSSTYFYKYKALFPNDAPRLHSGISHAPLYIDQLYFLTIRIPCHHHTQVAFSEWRARHFEWRCFIPLFDGLDKIPSETRIVCTPAFLIGRFQQVPSPIWLDHVLPCRQFKLDSISHRFWKIRPRSFG